MEKSSSEQLSKTYENMYLAKIFYYLKRSKLNTVVDNWINPWCHHPSLFSPHCSFKRKLKCFLEIRNGTEQKMNEFYFQLTDGWMDIFFFSFHQVDLKFSYFPENISVKQTGSSMKKMKFSVKYLHYQSLGFWCIYICLHCLHI